VSDLGFAQARSIVFERKLLFGLVQPKRAQAIGVGEFTEAEKLRVGEGRVEFVSHVNESHEESIAGRSRGSEKRA